MLLCTRRHRGNPATRWAHVVTEEWQSAQHLLVLRCLAGSGAVAPRVLQHLPVAGGLGLGTLLRASSRVLSSTPRLPHPCLCRRSCFALLRFCRSGGGLRALLGRQAAGLGLLHGSIGGRAAGGSLLLRMLRKQLLLLCLCLRLLHRPLIIFLCFQQVILLLGHRNPRGEHFARFCDHH